MENKNITRKSVLAYGMGGFGRQSLYIIQNTFLLYYFVSVAGLNSAAVGIMMMLAKYDPIFCMVLYHLQSAFLLCLPFLRDSVRPVK